MATKKEIRKNFRDAVFKRDDMKCVICGMPNNGENMDAHHITDRSEMPNGGYVLENGISLCNEDKHQTYSVEDSCHKKAEKFHISGGEEWVEDMHPDDLYKLIGSSKEEAIEASLKL